MTLFSCSVIQNLYWIISYCNRYSQSVKSWWSSDPQDEGRPCVCMLINKPWLNMLISILEVIKDAISCTFCYRCKNDHFRMRASEPLHWGVCHHESYIPAWVQLHTFCQMIITWPCMYEQGATWLSRDCHMTLATWGSGIPPAMQSSAMELPAVVVMLRGGTVMLGATRRVKGRERVYTHQVSVTTKHDKGCQEVIAPQCHTHLAVAVLPLAQCTVPRLHCS